VKRIALLDSMRKEKAKETKDKEKGTSLITYQQGKWDITDNISKVAAFPSPPMCPLTA
jgi:hypothetical protein